MEILLKFTFYFPEFSWWSTETNLRDINWAIQDCASKIGQRRLDARVWSGSL